MSMKQTYSKEHKFETFEVKSGAIVISDPCYDGGSHRVPAVNGAWVAHVTEQRGVIGTLVVECEEHSGSREKELDVGVDSGQAGVFDSAIYPEGETGEFEDSTSFYGKACSKTLAPGRWGIIDGQGAVSSTGYGDGCYEATVTLNDEGKAVRVEIDFLPSDEEEEEEGESECERCGTPKEDDYNDLCEPCQEEEEEGEE